MFNRFEIVQALEEAAVSETDDEFSNELSRMANRLGYTGAPFEDPLTASELAFITSFTDAMNQHAGVVYRLCLGFPTQ